ncbi:MAG: GMC family oxidoreductase N-terminal domain-containing protein [Gaiellales bacterium]
MHDVLVIGAGTAGCVLASRLSDDPRCRVMLVEAGPRDRKLEVRIPAAFSKLFGSKLDWGYRTTSQGALDDRRLVYPRGRLLGGSAAINAMMALRGHRSDYEPWPQSWQWETVERLYAKSSPEFAVTQPATPSPMALAFCETAARVLAITRRDDLNDPDNDGVGLTPLSIRDGARWSVVDGYLRPVLKRPNLTLETGTTVHRLLFEGKRVTGALGSTGRELRELRARTVVLAGGSIGSPAILLRSGIGPAAELARHGIDRHVESAGVGANLRDHLANGVLVETRPGVTTLASAETIPNVLRWLLRKQGPLTSNVAEAAAFVRTDPTLAAPDLELIFAPVPFENEGTTKPSFDGFTVATVLLQPKSVGSVRLASSDPAAAPLIDPGFLTDPDGDDHRLVRYGIRLARTIAGTAPLAGFAAKERLPGPELTTDDELATHVRAVSQTLYHPVGTCRMGDDPASVVDPELRVRGVDGLRVVDASVIPTLPRGHTNWPAVIVAERGAELLALGSDPRE